MVLTMLRDCFGSERSNAGRHDRLPLVEILSQGVVERAKCGRSP